MKILLTADWHLSNKLPHSRQVGNGVTDRLNDQVAVLGKVEQIANKENVHAIFVLGDMFDKRLTDGVTLDVAIQSLVSLSKSAPVYVLPGNHEVNGSNGSRYLTEFVGSLSSDFGHMINYLDGSLPVFLDDGLVGLYPLPWRPLETATGEIARLRELADANRANESGHMAVLLLHQAINGCFDGKWKCDDGLDPTEVCDGWDAVFAGDFHECQTFGSCGMYVGAPMQHDFKDAGSPTRGVVIAEIDADSRKSTTRLHEINSPAFVSMAVDHPPKDAAEIVASAGDYLSVTVKATHQDWLAWQPRLDALVAELRGRELHALPPKHAPIAQVEARLAGAGKAPSFEEVASMYIKSANTDGLDPDKLTEIARTLMREVRDG